MVHLLVHHSHQAHLHTNPPPVLHALVRKVVTLRTHPYSTTCVKASLCTRLHSTTHPTICPATAGASPAAPGARPAVAALAAAVQAGPKSQLAIHEQDALKAMTGAQLKVIFNSASTCGAVYPLSPLCALHPPGDVKMRLGGAQGVLREGDAY